MGRKEGMAAGYANLGGLKKEFGDESAARKYWETALQLYREIGMKHMLKKVQGWLDGVAKDG